MLRTWVSDTMAVLRGAQMVGTAVLKHQGEVLKHSADHSSVRTLVEEGLKSTGKNLAEIDPSKVPEKLAMEAKEALEKICVVQEGISKYLELQVSGATDPSEKPETAKTRLHVYNPAKDPKEVPVDPDPKDASTQTTSDLGNQKSRMKKYTSVKEKIDTITSSNRTIPKIELSDKEKEILRKLELEHERKIKKESTANFDAEKPKESEPEAVEEEKLVPSPMKPSVRPKQTLSVNAKARKVPSTRIQRMVSFGTLGVGLGLGTLAEYTRRSLGMKEQSIGQTVDSMFLTKANAERIVSTLCKVRGAALKIGQILSIQDNSVISPELQKAFERVRQSADFMPAWQVEKVLASELGHDWRSKTATFEEKPFAAASIGQVHHATLSNGQHVAMKIQYPGVALGIQSDIENLVGIMKVWNMFPEGMFIDNLVEVAKRELAWEVDYVREKECTKKYKELVAPYPDFYVPQVIDELSTAQVFTTELVEGIPVDKCVEMDEKTREHIARMIMDLCLKELFVFRFMQTDPNWSNFFYHPESKKLILLDFGACRTYEKSFMDKYIEVINAASERDRGKVLKLSQEMGFLTGYETKVMEEAHVDSVMILGQVFDKEREFFDFGAQDVTKRIQKLVPTIINHRLCPPPEEIYSLHRKLSGVFLLCVKLQVKINCRDLFLKIYNNYRFG